MVPPDIFGLLLGVVPARELGALLAALQVLPVLLRVYYKRYEAAIYSNSRASCRMLVLSSGLL